jgi:hypothetical protein
VNHYNLGDPVVGIFIKLATLIYYFVVSLNHANLDSTSLGVDGYGWGTYFIDLVDRGLIKLLLNDMQAMLSPLLDAYGTLVAITDH